MRYVERCTRGYVHLKLDITVANSRLPSKSGLHGVCRVSARKDLMRERKKKGD